MKNTCPFYILFSSFEVPSYKNMQDTVTRTFISCCFYFISFYNSRYYFSQMFVFFTALFLGICLSNEDMNIRQSTACIQYYYYY